MIAIDDIARELQMISDALVKGSLKAYLEKNANLEVDIFQIVKKYGIRDVCDMDTRIQ